MSLRCLSLLLAIVWMAALFWLSHQPGIDAPMLFPGQDKVFHAGVYGILGIFLLGAMRPVYTGYTSGQIRTSVVIASLYGISDEFHQSFVPGRSADILDWAADSTGALLAAILFAQLTRFILQSKRATS